MADYLLIGAGFSRNWGGWLAAEAFEYLLGCPEVVSNQTLKQILWRHQGLGGFESALAEIQHAYSRDPQTNESILMGFQTAITRMFDDMNKAFIENNVWEFQQYIEYQVGTFLTRFDAIFSLNQDLLLEHYYINDNIALTGKRDWNGAQFPGMQRILSQEPIHSNSWAHSTWLSNQESEFRVDPACQPIFKLHGSSNWRHADGRTLLIMGGAKAMEISQTPILNWYAREFEHYLLQPQSRLMVIGYGFRDDHINAILSGAIEQGLKLFIIAPEGAELARNINPTRDRATIIVPTTLESALEVSLIGASRRPLSSTFGGDVAEFNKVMRFFKS